jgi:hypothetical protein
LHTGQDPHHATFVDVADDSLVIFTALDVELGNSIVFNDRYLFLASVDANN